jgi:hypothetical protein
MRALKTLVVGMGVAILIGASVLATLIFERGTRLAAGNAAGDAPAAASSVAVAARHRLLLPRGAEVRETRLDGSRIVLRARVGGGNESIFVFDGTDGRLVARYEIAPEGAQ